MSRIPFPFCTARESLLSPAHARTQKRGDSSKALKIVDLQMPRKHYVFLMALKAIVSLPSKHAREPCSSLFFGLVYLFYQSIYWYTFSYITYLYTFRFLYILENINQI